MKKALFEFEIPLSDEYMPFLDDLIRVVIIQLVTQFMFYMYNSDDYPLFNESFFLTMVFLMLGVCAYWLIVKKIIFVKPVVARNSSVSTSTFTSKKNVNFVEQFQQQQQYEDEPSYQPYDDEEDRFSEYSYS